MSVKFSEFLYTIRATNRVNPITRTPGVSVLDIDSIAPEFLTAPTRNHSPFRRTKFAVNRVESSNYLSTKSPIELVICSVGEGYDINIAFVLLDGQELKRG
jgi:hypothetical protein